MRRGFAQLGCALCLAALCLIAPSAAAQRERITRYNSDVDVRDDGSMLVRETIQVVSAGIQIRHGIYRDFPTRYRDRFGNRYVVGFELVSATRDGAPEISRVEDVSNGKRIYLGSAGDLLANGTHVYTITYTTSRQLGFFRDHDELFWNVTGNGWAFLIERASATVRLPERIPRDRVSLGGYTGLQGSLTEDLATVSNSDGSFSFAANHELGPREGLTILLSFPKGYFAEPTASEKFQYFVNDNLDAVVIGAGLAAILIYYLIVWTLVGRDPAPGVIVSLYEPPDGFSPAAMRYLARMGYDNKAFAAAVLDLAVKGYLQIREQAGSYTLYLKNNKARNLSPDENAVAAKLFDGRDEIWLHNENHVQISASMAALKAWLKATELKIYFVTNGKYLIPAIVLSVVVLVGTIAAQGPQKMAPAAFLCVWLTVWSIVVAGLIIVVSHLWASAFQGGHLKPGMMTQAIVLTLFSIPFIGGEIFGLSALAAETSIVVVLALVATIALHVLFHYLLKRPTRAGRAVLDKIEGFKMFLGAVEGDRLNRMAEPEKTPEVFERYLPFALALDVEQAWAQKFSGILGAAGQTPGTSSSSYSPSWYSGGAWSGLGAAGFASSLSGSFSSAISSSATAPGSGGGGGGGGSGGGGGGGGGGGWSRSH
jgi:hypothetical protein